MTAASFMDLSLSQRMTLVKEQGVYLLAATCDDHVHVYYHMPGFLVEVVQVFEGLVVDEAEAFMDGDPRMDDMLDQIFPEELLDFLDDMPPFLR